MSLSTGPVLLRSEVVVIVSVRDITRNTKFTAQKKLFPKFNTKFTLTHPFSCPNPSITQQPSQTLTKPRILTRQRLQLLTRAQIRNLHHYNRPPMPTITATSSSEASQHLELRAAEHGATPALSGYLWRRSAPEELLGQRKLTRTSHKCNTTQIPAIKLSRESARKSE
ncbi:unnamed protein product [Sphenostylis stenocarpa]|uniref:Uncharacterized protein n=1 Tax=Sphenostylis stenocarpa TaxID=92480 RepID=A0AA86TG41_9FABA|nr:unnamed protein product [Sphenostylis stenocarpa]